MNVHLTTDQTLTEYVPTTDTGKNILERITSTALGRYGLSIGSFLILVGISAFLTYIGFKISLTILILVGLVVSAWYGGLGPGILMAVLIVATTMLSQPRPPDISIAMYAFGHFSNFALTTFIVWLIHSRKVAEMRLRDKSVQLQDLNHSLERRVAERTTDLEAANRELASFSYSVSHDLRAPLRTIDGFSRVLVEDHEAKLDDDAKGLLENISGAARKMDALIDDLLQLATITKSELKRETVDLSAIANNILSELKAREPLRAVECEIQNGVTAFADERLARIAMQNLLDNAWKFTGKVAGAKVVFGTSDAGGINEFFVHDNGAGFDMRYADKLFRPFERLHSETEFDGTGIGLATVQRVIQKHGGMIRAEGEEGKGSKFYFTLV